VKPLVRYVGRAERVDRGEHIAARLEPLDHPDARLNGEIIITSPVLKWEPDGRITTRNTRYMPAEYIKMPWHEREVLCESV
jgi:hypothetical protein